MNSTDNIIEIVNLTKQYKNKIVLNNINLNIKKGKSYGFIGINGSGKSLLFKIICGFVRPTSGYINVNGKKIGIDTDFPENIGVLIEHPGFLPEYTAFENLKFLASINNKIGKTEIENAIKCVNLDIDNHESVKKYSLGMKQRLGIAQAIMEDPEILILDEPMNGLDKNGVKLIKQKLLELKMKGKTILLTSHISQDINELSDYIYEFDNGGLSQKL
ncbi:ATP-binding cassette domain-containing protein (plasmid) [Clostridium tyrobutyricum]|jgi:ABC-2 type transport system ATP-binding protein|uniref:ABC transporter, ATP-binding protein n=1 Tax=Clostridium tyrobutyricum DIVETGP TaxID=1408889 RepID=W6NGL9_CLOTY|nr:ATP-binding cassette domain-containing protein [Clostridium tyrobutyricum]AND86368.1 ABC transporter ATPase component [Clostridium tyrobutyricum]ANP70956.1 multidrug ABC transporter ATP-binding protein [Clostridium tyrobutyricum]MBV4432630.1 ATP-binding cassette domain-containing protein [Clostridium tyrobutyricum]MBV4435718.1 ATP-binding cassette domain-containing protein [Clostridium tyrobutyricum]QCH29349.1 Fluoroquinolones export ATP-binding protein [Clostridium tyrobutyricum]